MSRTITAFDPLGKRAERSGFIRTEAIHLPPSDRPGVPTGCCGEKEEPGITLWAGPRVVFINAVFPGIDLKDLQIRITGTRLVFSGPLGSDTTTTRPGRRRVQRTPTFFSHSVELPYPVDAERAEVRRENGLISIILKKAPSPAGDSDARLESSIMNSMKRYFGDYGRLSGKHADEDMILQSLEKYFHYISKEGNALYRGPQP
ncbi:MAG: Hsp20/alpha crystallin family protein [Syntrophaceae bacterium]